MMVVVVIVMGLLVVMGVMVRGWGMVMVERSPIGGCHPQLGIVS